MIHARFSPCTTEEEAMGAGHCFVQTSLQARVACSQFVTGYSLPHCVRDAPDRGKKKTCSLLPRFGRISALMPKLQCEISCTLLTRITISELNHRGCRIHTSVDVVLHFQKSSYWSLKTPFVSPATACRFAPRWLGLIRSVIPEKTSLSLLDTGCHGLG